MPAAAVRSSTSARATTTHTGASAGRVTPHLSAMVIAAVSAGADTALTARFSISPGGLAVAVERPGGCAGTVVNIAVRDCAMVVIAAVIKSSAVGVVCRVVIENDVVVPIESPMIPAPAVAAEPADSEADSE